MTQKLYIGNLQYHTTVEDLRILFRRYEPIFSIVLISDKETRQPLGYGFIELEEHMALRAIYHLDAKVYRGRSLKLSKATGRDPRKPDDDMCAIVKCCLNCPKILRALGARVRAPRAADF